MRRRSTTLFLLTTLAIAGCTPSAPAATAVPRGGVLPAQAFATDLVPLEEAIRARIANETGEYGVAVIDIETGRTGGVNERVVMHAASTMKVPVLLELYRRAAEGRLQLDETMTVTATFRSIADTSHYTLSSEDDSEHTLYDRIGERVSFRELARLMTVRSSNLATNILIDTLVATTIQETTNRVGAHGMRVLRGVEDTPAFNAGMNNNTTALGLARVLASIARCDVLPRAQCDEVIDVLAAQEFNEMIPAGLPPGTRVAHKTGSITGIQHDGAIIMPDGSAPYVLVVLSRGGADTTAVRNVAADIARLSWQMLGPEGTLRPRWSASTAELVALHQRVRVPAFPAPELGYDELWGALAPIADGAPGIEREVTGRSASGRPLYLLRAGTGPTRVLFWSQMHGDETTASRSLTDLFSYIATSPNEARVQRWLERLTILAVPMLNPDGADAHRRRSAFGIDINRDARVLSTPEGRALKQVQEQYRPQFGFNLHDQNPRSRVGSSSRMAAIALLAPAPDDDATPTPGFVRARHLTAHLATVLAPLLGQHLTRYDDTYNARAFGDGMQSWGVSTVLIESGSWRGDEPKHYLRTANFVAMAAALDAIAEGSYMSSDVSRYTDLPENGRAVNDLVIRDGSIVLPGMQPYRADIGINGRSVGGPAGTEIVEIGDLQGVESRDTIDATGLFIHPETPNGVPSLQPGMPPVFRLRRSADPSSEIVWEIVGLRARRMMVR
ncbi:MAG TPA: serine hydrolase [Longimicrobiales bacterium]|nr:serine hydrolase [Longimicrobiales bacterium]